LQSDKDWVVDTWIATYSNFETVILLQLLFHIWLARQCKQIVKPKQKTTNFYFKIVLQAK